MKKVFKNLSVYLSLVMLVSILAACSGNGTEQPKNGSEGTKAETKETLKEESELLYTMLTVFDETPRLGFDNPNDVVTPEIEKKFNIKVKDVIFSGGVSPVERINMLVAAGNVPDVVMVDNPNIAAFFKTEAFMDLTPYKDMMVNTDIYVTDAGWNRLMVDGKLVAISGDMSGGEIDVNHPAIKDAVSKDVFYKRPQNWALVVNQDILEKAGYQFKKINQLQEELDLNIRSITDADVQIEPAINTVEDLETLLYKIKELNLKVNGKPVIPLSIPDWAAYHLSVIKAPTGGWYADPDTMEVTGYLFNPGMKEFYKIWKKWYSDGILDQEYILHKAEQYQEKAASGRVGVMFPGFDVNAVRQSLKENGNDLKVIPWPTSTKGNSIDPSYPGGFRNVMINKDFKEAERLLKYFDWFQTDEAKELISWGPESAGLWEIKDGTKKLIDNELYEAMKNGAKTADGRDAEYYGLASFTEGPLSKAALTAPGVLYNNKSIERSYPAQLDAYTQSFIYVSTEMLNRDGTVLSNAGEKSGVVGSYYWSTIKTTYIAQLLSAKSDEEFDKVWEDSLKDIKNKVPYDEAIQEMLPEFMKSLGK